MFGVGGYGELGFGEDGETAPGNVDVVSGIIRIVGATPTIGASATTIVVVPGAIQVVGATPTVSAATRIDVVPGVVQIKGKIPVIAGGASRDFLVSAVPRVEPFLIATVSIGVPS